MVGTFWALVPPILAIVLALITKEAYSSLFIGVVVGALFVSGGSVVGALNALISDGDAPGGMIAAVAGNAGIFIFLVLLGIIVALVNQSGGSAAFGRWAEKNIKSRVGAMLATFFLGVLIFIDDYFNCLTVGSVMRPVTDSHRISRAKLAYLIDATAAPVCMIAPVSSWAAAVSATADKLGTGISGIQLFIRAIPYNFYSLLTFVFIIAIVCMKFDYGPMKLHEMAALLEGKLGEQEGGEESKGNPKGRVLDLILPVVILIVTCTIGMLYVAAGGAPTESFLSEQTMCAVGKDGKPVYPHLAAIATNRHRLDQNKDFPCAWVAREYPRRRANKEEAYWWPVSKMYDNGIKRIKDSGIHVDGILWYQGESNATTCVAPDTPTDRDYQLETLRALVSELRSVSQLTTHNSQLPTFIMMGLPKMNRPWEQYRAVQKQVCDETGAIFVDTFAAGLGEANDVHPRDKTVFADLAAKAASAGK